MPFLKNSPPLKVASIAALLLASTIASGCASAPPPGPKYDPVALALLEKAVFMHRADFQACYDAEPGNKKNKPDGTIIIRFVVAAADGRLVGAAVQGPGSTLDEPNVASCLLDVVVSTKFPKPQTKDGQDVQVLYPFHFNAGALPKGPANGGGHL